jgi:hypothetical protein
MKLQDFQLNLQILIDYVNFCCGNDMTKFYDKTKTNKLFSKKFFKSKVSLKVKNLVEKNNKLVEMTSSSSFPGLVSIDK